MRPPLGYHKIASAASLCSPGTVEIEGIGATVGEPMVVSDLSRTIIGAVVDEYEVADEGGVRRFRLLKRSRT